MNQGMTWPILGALMGVSLAACGDASIGDAGEPNPGANDATVDALSEASDGGATMDAADGSSTTTAVVCPPLPDGGFGANGIGPAESAASGTLVGSAVNCSLCSLGAVVIVQTRQYGDPPIVDYTLSLSSQAGGEGTCTIPSDSSNATFSTFNAGIQLNGIQPGTYSSSQSTSSTSCTSIELYYTLPSPSITDCQGAVGPNCPFGCEVRSCEDTGADASELCPCLPAGAPSVGYTVLGPSCFAAAVGSWQVVLTSVVPYAGNAGLQTGTVAYTVHGSVIADLIAGSTDGGGPPEGDQATLSLTF